MRASPQQRPQQRVAAKTAVEVGEVVVDAEGEAHALDRDPQRLATGGALGGGRAEQVGGRDRSRLERIGAEANDLRRRLPGADENRRPANVQQAGRHPAGDPHHPVAAARGQPERPRRTHLDLERPTRGPVRRSPSEQVHVHEEGAAGDDVGGSGLAPGDPPRGAPAAADGADRAHRGHRRRPREGATGGG